MKKDFVWEGYQFKENTLTLLDLYGTNHDKRLWNEPFEFQPERFQEQTDKVDYLIPQDGGDYLTGHRCPGEFATIKMMKIAADFLANKINYDLPKQDFTYSMTEMPSMPKDKMILENVRWKE